MLTQSLKRLAVLALGLAAALAFTAAPAATTNQPASVDLVLVPIHLSGQYTADTTAVARYKLPFAARLIGVSVAARASGGTSPTLTVDVLEAGTTVLSSVVSVSTSAATEAAIADTDLADEAEITINLDLGGTSPTWNDISILLTLVRH